MLSPLLQKFASAGLREWFCSQINPSGCLKISHVQQIRKDKEVGNQSSSCFGPLFGLWNKKNVRKIGKGKESKAIVRVHHQHKEVTSMQKDWRGNSLEN